VGAVSASAHGRYLQRQHLPDLGSAALAYVTELTHRRLQIWIHHIERLHDLLETNREAAMRQALARGLAEQAIGAEHIAHYLGDTSPGLPFDAVSDRPPTIAALACRAEGASRSPKAPAGAERSGAPGRDRARRYDLAPSEAGHDPIRISMRSSSACISPMPGAFDATSWQLAEREMWSSRFPHAAGDGRNRPSTKDTARTYQSSLRVHMLGSALAPDFVTERRSLIFSGKRDRKRRIWRSRWLTVRSRMVSTPSS
jgi:hypothetical protein